MPYSTQPTRVFFIAHMNSSQIPPQTKKSVPPHHPAPSDIEIEASGPPKGVTVTGYKGFWSLQKIPT